MGTSSANTRRSSAETRDRLIDAAGRVLRQEGYAKASARTIAGAAGVNSALVFYHFGGVDPLLLAALDRSSEQRMLMHRPVAESARTVEQLVEAAAQIYRADVEGGHITLFTELVAASVSKPELRPEINSRAEPWLAFIEQTWDRVVGGTPLGRMLPAREVAYGAITFYLGVNLFSVLDEDSTRTDAVFALAGRMAPRAKLLTMRLPGSGRGRGAAPPAETGS